MRIALINPPYRAVSSKVGVGAQIPFGLLCIGGPLLDAGHEVCLIDAEVHNLSLDEIAEQALSFGAQVILTGHSGSTPAHPITAKMATRIKEALPDATIIYGGVYPSYHAKEVIEREQQFDIVVRGEGERTTLGIINGLETGKPLALVTGIAYRREDQAVLTPPTEFIMDLDSCRVGWELIEDWNDYQCWGVGSAAIIQFSRGCPHLCTYCGQRGFWTKWRYRDPKKLAAEIGWLHREHGINFIDMADENPTSSKRVWRAFLEALIEENLNVKIFSTIRAADIVRDADILHLYKQAGFECILMGMETTDASTMERIRKGSTTATDLRAIQLLREHNMLSMVGHIVGFEEERDRDYWNALRQLLLYGPDLVNAMYVTPHRWTPFYSENTSRKVVLEDRSKWDYRHQVLATRHMRPWRVFLWVKFIEVIVHLRPSALWRLIAHPDRSIRRALRWCYGGSALAWIDELHDFFIRSHYRKNGPTLEKFWGRGDAENEEALAKPLKKRAV